MTLRAGSYDANHHPDWRGIIRQDGYPWYRCTHTHHGDPRDARDCARLALPALRGRHDGAPLPAGWEVFPRPAG